MARASTERLLRRTQRRLFAVTLALLVLLVVGVGAATLLITTTALDADVDSALRAAVQAEATGLGGELPGDEERQEHGDDVSPAVADTVLVVTDAAGNVLRVRGTLPPGLPNREAIPAAADGEDWRTVEAGRSEARVLTVPVVEDGTVVAYVQGAFDLTLHEAQARSLVIAVVTVGALALLAAALITLLVTSRALVPIRESFEAQRRFVADASHELRTPAALIRANAEVMEREGLVAPDGRDLLADVIAEADRLGGLVGDLLQLAAWDETSLTVTPVIVDAAEVARDTVRGAGALAAERGVVLAVDAGAAAPAKADRARLVQLLLILVDNAIDHSPAGATVNVRVATEGESVVIRVDDQGPGIPEAERARVFEPFTRLPGTTRHGSGGTGLGLAIARRITDAHGGRIEAGTNPAGGARLTVALPAGRSGGSAAERGQP
jgi:signal transduction histidine kinase